MGTKGQAGVDGVENVVVEVKDTLLARVPEVDFAHSMVYRANVRSCGYPVRDCVSWSLVSASLYHQGNVLI